MSLIRGRGVEQLHTEAAQLDPAAVREHLDGYLDTRAGEHGELVIWSTPTKVARTFTTDTDGLDAATDYTAELDAAGATGIYHRGTTVTAGSVGPGRRGGDEHTRMWLRFQLDGDHGKPGAPPDPDTVRRLVEKAVPLDPSGWIDSGHGLYPTWNLHPAVHDSPDVRALAVDLHAAVAAVYVDLGYTLDSCHDASRVWRIPGTVNRKVADQPVLCRVVEHTGAVYRFGELRAAVPTRGGPETGSGSPAPSGLPPVAAHTAVWALLKSLPDGPACAPVQRRRAQALDVTRGADRHRGMLRPLQQLVRLGEQGHAGVPAVLTELETAFVAAVAPDRAGGADEAVREFEHEVIGAAAKVLGDPTPEEDKRCCGAETGSDGPAPGTADDGHATGTSEAAPTSWTPLDLGPYLRGEVPEVRPSIGCRRLDGQPLLYPALEHLAIGESESGKSWWALMHVASVLLAGGSVVYCHFEESSPADTITRLRLLGVPHHRLFAGLRFVTPETAITAGVLGELVAVPPALVVLDGVNEAMALHGLDVMKPEGAAGYRQRLVKPFTAVGAAVLSLDHVVKDSERNGGGYALGSAHKINGVNGAVFLLENVEPFGKGRSGSSSVFVTKDRPGWLRAHSTPTRIPRKFYCATMVVESGDEFRFGLYPPAADDQDADTGTQDPDGAAVLAAVQAITSRGRTATVRGVEGTAGISKARVGPTLERLLHAGLLTETRGARGARIFAPAPSPEDQQ